MGKETGRMHTENETEQADGVQPLHTPLPEPVRRRQGRMEFRIDTEDFGFDIEIEDRDEFDV